MGNSNVVRALVGARVSSVQGDEKTSHITQTSKGQAYAESQDWTVVGAFEDLDVSAITLSPWDRPDLRHWLTDRASDWDALIFAKTDRVFRSAADCVRLAEWCKEHHKILVLVDDGIRLDYYHPEDARDAFAGAMSKVFLILAATFAEIEGQRFVQRARDRVAYLRRTDRWGHGLPPYGFKIVDHPGYSDPRCTPKRHEAGCSCRTGKGKALDHDPDAQRVLHDAAKKFLAGESLTRITARFNEDGVLSPREWNRVRSGKPTKGCRWTPSKLKVILGNPGTQGLKTASGKLLLDAEGEPIRVGPPSFDPETWDRIQSELAQRSREPHKHRHSINPLLGVAKCAVCGKNMRQRSQATPAGVTYRYYVCSGSPKPCPSVSFIADRAEEIVADAFLETHADRNVKARAWQQGSDHSAELEQTNRTIESLREDRAMGLYPTADDENTFRQQMKSLVAKRDALATMPIVPAGWIEVETDQIYSEVWPAATTEERRTLLTDAGVRLVVRRANDYGIEMDFDRVLGEGPSGHELQDQLEARAAEERKRHGVPD